MLAFLFWVRGHADNERRYFDPTIETIVFQR
jgi:hypothetical protein